MERSRDNHLYKNKNKEINTKQSKINEIIQIFLIYFPFLRFFGSIFSV